MKRVILLCTSLLSDGGKQGKDVKRDLVQNAHLQGHFQQVRERAEVSVYSQHWAEETQLWLLPVLQISLTR